MKAWPGARNRTASRSTGRWRCSQGSVGAWSRLRRRPDVATQAVDPGESQASDPVCELPLRLGNGAESRSGTRAHRAARCCCRSPARHTAAFSPAVNRMTGPSREDSERLGRHRCAAGACMWLRPTKASAIPNGIDDSRVPATRRLRIARACEVNPQGAPRVAVLFGARGGYGGS